MIDVFEGVELPDDFVTQSAAIVARRGAGKTYTALKLVEQLVGANLPCAVLDPLGVCWGLRSSADGTKPGLPVRILGGDHGDVPLEPTGGTVAANFLVDHPGAYVLDLSGVGFDSNRAQDRFAEDFMVALFRAKNRDRTPLHLVVDEADSFAPQRPGPDQKKMLGAAEAIVRRGRSRGLGVTMITQRPAVLNKNVLSQVELLVALQVTSPHDRDALEKWAEGYGDKATVTTFLNALARLGVGDAWLWSPAWLDVFAPARVKARTTFDSSSTPKMGEERVEPRVLAPVDVDVLKEAMAASIEKAKAEDPKALQAELRSIRRELAEARKHQAEPERIEVTVEVPVVPPEVVRALEPLRGIAERLVQASEAVRDDVETALDRLTATLERVATATPAKRSKLPRASAASPTDAESRTGRLSRTGRALSAVPDPPEADEAYQPRAGALRMLEAVCRYPAGLTTAQVGTLAKVKRSGGAFGNYGSDLVRAGLVTIEGSVKAGTWRPTDAGMALAGTQLPADPAALRAEWRSRLTGSGATRMFDLLVDGYPDWTDRETLAHDAVMDIGGGAFGGYLRQLRSNGLIEESGDELRAHPDLFMEDE